MSRGTAAFERWLAPPYFPNDEEKTARARTMNTLGSYLVLILAFALFVYVPFFVKYKIESAAIILGLFVLYLIARAMMFRGYLTLAGLSFVACGWIVCQGIALIGGGIASPVMFALAAITIVVGLLFQARVGTVFLVLSILSGLGFAALQQSGFSLPQIFVYPPLSAWFYFAMSLAFIQGTMNFTMRRLENALVLARQENEARKQPEEALRKSEAEIRRALAEKEILLRELHHRTRNNMSVIDALLQMQADDIGDARLQNAYREIRHRIQSMALVHQKLYEAGDLSRLNLKEYIADLAELLLQSYSRAPGQVGYVDDMEAVFTQIDTALPCGLIVTELISNALKHAFPNGNAGQIRIGLRRAETGEIHLCVSDNGVGMPPGFDLDRDAGLGLQTVSVLAQSQLRGRIHLETAQGVACRLSFPDDLYEPRV